MTSFPISRPQHLLLVLKEPSQRDSSFEHQKQMFRLIDKKIMARVRSVVMSVTRCDLRLI